MEWIFQRLWEQLGRMVRYRCAIPGKIPELKS